MNFMELNQDNSMNGSGSRSRYRQSNNRNYENKGTMVNRMMNERLDGTMMLNPRLQEYLAKKKLYKEKNITTCVPLEKTYGITSSERREIREYLKGKTDLYKSQPISLEKKHSKIISKKRNKKQMFPSSMNGLRDDPRVKVLDDKKDMPQNMGMFYPDSDNAFYDVFEPNQTVNPMMDKRDFTLLDGKQSTYPINGVEFDRVDRNNFQTPEAKARQQAQMGYPLEEERFDPRADPRIYPGQQKYDPRQSQYRINNGDNRNKCIISNLEQNNNINDLIPDIVNRNVHQNTGYGNIGNSSYSEKSTMDFENKMVIPNVNPNNNRNLDTSNYKIMPFFADPRGKDRMSVETETAMIRGIPTHTQKSYGYRNPSEHYYDYAGGEFGPQAINNLVEPWIRGGDHTRGDNKSAARNARY